MISRRKLLVALGASALTAPCGSFAQQQSKVWRVGFLVAPGHAVALDPNFYGAFALGMRDLGYVEGKNLVIEWRFADGDVKRLPGLAAELVQLKPDVLLGGGNDAPLALQKTTTTIPIVMTSNNDPLGGGLIKSLARPGGNTTGLSDMSTELGPKRLELLLGMMPKLARVAVLLNPSPSGIKSLEIIQTAAKQIGVRILPVEARTPGEIDKAFVLMRQQNAEAVMVLQNPSFQQQKSQIATLAAKQRLPAMTPFSIYAEAGGLMSYGPNYADNYRRGATYVDKIFKGAKPGDIPVEQPTIFELIINGKTAKALGLKIPQSLLITADKVIE